MEMTYGTRQRQEMTFSDKYMCISVKPEHTYQNRAHSNLLIRCKISTKDTIFFGQSITKKEPEATNLFIDMIKTSCIYNFPLPFSLCAFLSLQQSGAAGEGEGRDAENEIRRKEEHCWKPRRADEQWLSSFVKLNMFKTNHLIKC